MVDTKVTDQRDGNPAMHKNNSPDGRMNGRGWTGEKKTDKERFSGTVS